MDKHQLSKGDVVRIICDDREFRGTIRTINKDDSVTIRDPRESYGHKVYYESIVEVTEDRP